MSNAIWGDPKSTGDEHYPLKLLKGLLQDLLRQVPAYGVCLALYDESISQMVVRLHLRCSGEYTTDTDEACLEAGGSPTRAFLRCNHVRLVERMASVSDAPKNQEDRFLLVQTTGEAALFPLGSAYPPGQDMIGVTWRNDQSYYLSHEQYQTLRTRAHQLPIDETFTPAWYMTVPLKAPELVYEEADRRPPLSQMLGVIVLYQLVPHTGLQSYQRHIILQQAERIGLYLQNDRLMRLQMRTRDHIKHLQHIGMTFPNSLQLSDLVDEVYRFVVNTVDVSSVLLTLYDRDTKKLYDVFAVNRGRRIDGLTDRPVISNPAERPRWLQWMQRDRRTLLLALDKHDREEMWANQELLDGTWGDQTDAQTFLLIPMKMFTRIVGSLSLSSQRSQAYGPLEILVLETMVQVITVAIENAKLYERPRLALKQSKRREEALAATISALQAISTVLNVRELLHKFVETVANLVRAEMCSFFQLLPDGKDLAAQAVFDRTGKWNACDRAPSSGRDDHDELIQMIRLPFAGTLLEKLVDEPFFYLEETALDEIAQTSCESGAIFLREIRAQKILVVPVRRYQTDVVGILVIHTPQLHRIFQPEEISVVMAISAQAANAIRNAQLFEQIQEANAELQRMDKVKDEFIVTASHELRTPLSAISGYSSLLKKQGEHERVTPQQVLKYAGKIVGSAQQLKDLVDNMTQAARMGALEKNLELELVPSHLLAAAQTATNMLNLDLDQPIMVTIPADLWALGNTLHLRQVITNLLDNAVKYSPPHGRIEMKAQAMRLSQLAETQADQVDYDVLTSGKDPDIIKVSICDEGEGIALEDAERVFEKFVRAPRSLTTPVRGTGLGLFICRRFIEAMNGRLWLEISIPGRGSIFSFYLMRAQPAGRRGQDDTEPESETQDTTHPTRSTAERAGR